MPKTRKKTKRGSGGFVDSDWLSTGAVAARCGVSRDGVVHWIHAGKLPAFRTPGGHFRVLRADLERFLVESGWRYVPEGAAEEERP